MTKHQLGSTVKLLRQADGWQSEPNDYSFIRKLEKDYGYLPVRRAVGRLVRVAKQIEPEGLKAALVSFCQEEEENLKIQEYAERKKEFLKRKTEKVLEGGGKSTTHHP